MDVLVTGFEPFGEHTQNPSQIIAERLGGAVLPVSAGRLPAALDAALERHRPRLLIGLGLAAGRSMLALERVAINVLDFPMPDIDGHQPAGDPVVEGGLAAQLATLPLKPIVKSWEAHGLPGYLSNTAGTFCCNQVLYLALNRAGQDLKAGFIHLPLLPEQAAASRQQMVPTMALDLMLRGVELAVESALAPVR